MTDIRHEITRNYHKNFIYNKSTFHYSFSFTNNRHEKNMKCWCYSISFYGWSPWILMKSHSWIQHRVLTNRLNLHVFWNWTSICNRHGNERKCWIQRVNECWLVESSTSVVKSSMNRHSTLQMISLTPNSKIELRSARSSNAKYFTLPLV